MRTSLIFIFSLGTYIITTDTSPDHLTPYIHTCKDDFRTMAQTKDGKRLDVVVNTGKDWEHLQP